MIERRKVIESRSGNIFAATQAIFGQEIPEISSRLLKTGKKSTVYGRMLRLKYNS